MSFILLSLTTFTSLFSRLISNLTFNNFNIIKVIILISSGLIALPTIMDWSDLGVYYLTDGFSDVLVILTAFLIPTSIISNWNNIKNNLFFELVFNLGIILLINFMCQDILSFYIYFEVSLIPLFIMISLYGAANRDKAADYILIYTLFSSLFMLMSICIYQMLFNSTEYQMVNLMVLSMDLQSIMFMGMMMGVAVKTPMAPFHTWLPVVHSESPLAGSMLLAGVMLKLAIYAMMRLMLPTLSDASLLFTPFIYMLSLMTMMYTSLMTLRQTDLKVIIAYSSMSHMAVCLMGMLSNTYMGMNGSLMLSLAHGLVSPALFMMVGGILYDRYHNRLMYYYQGLMTYMPVLSVYLMMLSFCNVGAPLSLNFMGELFSMAGAINKSPMIGSMATMSVLLSASYQMKMTNRLTGGMKSKYVKSVADVTYRENLLMLLLMMPTMFFGMYPKWMMEMLTETNNVLYKM
ncbi:NADH dehydrogenase subunit 4 (mitochondrion) [Australozyma saopauloensis]|uniref:NADH-ubiquinone oxidoreductase chain 4 n=1 Tax=Australozyma saopauloensis TaxID=291208 RepID=A0AAX4HH62_9ASCO|nr:NADH dehydrogenase subunit 4 [[Candida] saopauloensis]